MEMALSDYRLCDVCEGKAFYDAQLSYEDGPPEYRDTDPYRVAGKPQYEDEALNQKHGMRLGYLGDWAVLCEDCAKTHRTVVLPIEPPHALLPHLTDYGSVDGMGERDRGEVLARLRRRWSALFATLSASPTATPKQE
jgi:hypothetical protein